MTVASETNRSGPYNGNGVTTIFNYGFRIVHENHLRVIRADAAGTETTLVIDTDYVVSDVGEPAGGQVALLVAPATGQTITILRNVPFTQETDLENQGAYYAETVEDALDLAAMRDQQMAEMLTRAVLVPPSSGDTGGALAAQLAEDITRLGQSADQIDTVADSIVAVETVADNIGSVGTVASNIAAVIAANGSALSLLDASYTGDGTDTTFTLPGEPVAAQNVLVWVDGVRQVPVDDYAVAGTTLTFVSAPGAAAEIDVLVISAVSMQYIETLVDAAVGAAANSSRVFASVAAMVAATNLVVGQTVRTAGYYAAGDGGAATYQVTSDGLAVDGYGEFLLAGGLLRARKAKGPIYWEQFGARADADIATSDTTWTDSQPMMQAAINFAQTVAARWFYTPLQTNPLGQYLRTPVMIRPASGGLFGISSPLVPISTNRGLVIEDTALIAKGTGWAKTDFMFSAGSVYTGYNYLNRCYFNCARKCSGIKAEARWTITDCVVRSMAAGTGAHTSDGSRTDAGIGMWLKGPLIEVLRPDIKELDNRSQDFFNQSAYGAIGIYISSTDARVRFGSVQWCLENMRIGTDGGANHKIESIHLANGMESYADYNVDGSTRVANPGGTPAQGRSYNPNLVVEPSAGASRPNIELHEVYFDNGSIHLYNPSVSFEDCEFNSNSAITNTAQADSQYWITCWAHAVGGTNEVRVRGAKVGVRSAARRGIRWEPYLSNTWAFNNSGYETSAQNLWDTKPDDHNVGGPAWFGVTGDWAVDRYRTLAGSGCFHGVRDENSTDFSYFGVVQDQAVIRSPNGSMRVDSWDGTTAVTMFRAAADHTLLARQASDPAGISNGSVVYNSTDDMLRARVAGAWVDLHKPTTVGTVTQATSKSTSVTLNQKRGIITTDAAALAAGAFIGFQLNNNQITANSMIVALVKTPIQKYNVQIVGVAAGVAYFRLNNHTAGSLSEAVEITFEVTN